MPAMGLYRETTKHPRPGLRGKLFAGMARSNRVGFSRRAVAGRARSYRSTGA